MGILRTGFSILPIAVVLALFGNMMCGAPAASQSLSEYTAVDRD
jgi:hypothetical protein